MTGTAQYGEGNQAEAKMYRHFNMDAVNHSVNTRPDICLVLYFDLSLVSTPWLISTPKLTEYIQKSHILNKFLGILFV